MALCGRVKYLMTGVTPSQRPGNAPRPRVLTGFKTRFVYALAGRVRLALKRPGEFWAGRGTVWGWRRFWGPALSLRRRERQSSGAGGAHHR